MVQDFRLGKSALGRNRAPTPPSPEELVLADQFAADQGQGSPPDPEAALKVLSSYTAGCLVSLETEDLVRGIAPVLRLLVQRGIPKLVGDRGEQMTLDWIEVTESEGEWSILLGSYALAPHKRNGRHRSFGLRRRGRRSPRARSVVRGR